jgi:hypothetical protein
MGFRGAILDAVRLYLLNCLFRLVTGFSRTRCNARLCTHLVPTAFTSKRMKINRNCLEARRSSLLSCDFHVTVYPPSTRMSAPVTYRDASESRKVTGPIKSFGWPILPCGMSDIHFAFRSGFSSRIFCVLIREQDIQVSHHPAKRRVEYVRMTKTTL